MFFVVPYLRVLYYSLIDSQFKRNFVRFDNYIETLQNKYFLLALKNSLLIILIAVPILMVLSLIISLALSYGIKWVRKNRFAFVLPMVIPTPIYCLIVSFFPMFRNSVLYAAAITIVQLVVIIPCAFGFSQAKFKGRGVLFVFYIILMMMPLQVTILPNYIGLRDMGLINHSLGIIFPMIFSPFGVVVMHQYMNECCNVRFFLPSPFQMISTRKISAAAPTALISATRNSLLYL